MLTYEQILQKIISPQEARELFTQGFRKDKQLVFTNGCFDVLHRGHIYYLSRARALGDVLVVGLNSDASVTLLKGPGRPVNSEAARAEVLGALAFVDYIIIFDEETPLKLINRIKPDILVKGGDYKAEDIVGYRELTERGGRVEIIPLLEGYSSSTIIDRNKA